jgi:hypothetical protein
MIYTPETKLSEHFTLREFIISQTAERKGIDNSIPNDKIMKNIKSLVENVLEPLRRFTRSPIIITSGYRSPELNKAIGGSPKSNRELYKSFIDAWQSGIIRGFDQLIWEFGTDYEPAWIHVSYKREFNKNRFELLQAIHTEKGVIYKQIDLVEILENLFFS